MESSTARMPTRHGWVVGLCLALTLVAAVIVAVLAPAGIRPGALGTTLAVMLVVSFAIQVFATDRVGFVARLSLTATGEFVIVLVAALIGLLV